MTDKDLGVDSEYAVRSAAVVGDAVRAAIELRGNCALMLAGGTTVQPIYCQWATEARFPHDRVTYFFGDERCVPPADANSNYGRAIGSLFPQGPPAGTRIHRMEAEKPERRAEARRYEELLPDSVDVLLLGMGEDGHIASLFPGSGALHEMDRRVVAVSGPKAPRDRLTITPAVIAAAGQVFLFATGSTKGEVLGRALQQPRDPMTLPVRLALTAKWLLDETATAALAKSAPSKITK